MDTRHKPPGFGDHLRAATSPKRRGDKQRQVILTTVRDLLQEMPFAKVSVSMISHRAGVARSGFYFYFESKYEVLAVILAEAVEELEELTHYFAPRGAVEPPELFVKRLVAGATAAFVHNRVVLSACNTARNTDAEIGKIVNAQIDLVIDQIVGVVRREIAGGDAQPISDDVPALVRTLAATTLLTLSGDTTFLGSESDIQRGAAVLEALWLHALWG